MQTGLNEKNPSRSSEFNMTVRSETNREIVLVHVCIDQRIGIGTFLQGTTHEPHRRKWSPKLVRQFAPGCNVERR